MIDEKTLDAVNRIEGYLSRITLALERATLPDMTNHVSTLAEPLSHKTVEKMFDLGQPPKPESMEQRAVAFLHANPHMHNITALALFARFELALFAKGQWVEAMAMELYNDTSLRHRGDFKQHMIAIIRRHATKAAGEA